MELTSLKNLDFQHLLRMFDQSTETDDNICILRSLDTNTKTDDSEWVLISTSVRPEKRFYRQILNINNNCINSLVLSNTNLFNLNEGSSCTTKPDFDYKLLIHPSQNDFLPKYASSANISIIESYRKTNNSIIDECLKNYFEIPRYLHSGDVISINIHNYARNKLFEEYKLSGRILYFKIKNLEGPQYSFEDQTNYGYLVSSERTTMYQVESVQCFIPRYDFETKEVIKIENLEDLLYPTVPSGMEIFYEKLEELIFPFLTIPTEDIKLTPIFLLHGKSGSGKSILISALAKKNGLHYWSENCILIQNSNPAQTESIINNIFTKISSVSPCILHLRYIEALCEDESGNVDDRTIDCFIQKIKLLKSNFPVIIFCTTSQESKLRPSLQRIFLQTLQMETLNYDSRNALLDWILKKESIEVENVKILENISRSTFNFAFSDLIQLVSRALRISSKFSRQIAISQTYDGKKLTDQDFSEALSEMNKTYANAIGAPEVPSVMWDDIGGLSHLKEEILTSLMNPVLPNGLKRSGLLLYGPPGTGKTLLAKAVATECKYNFLSVKGPELLNMYVGQSEKNVREVFSRARESSPCIVFFDELDSLAPRRGQSGGSGSVMDRVVSQLLAEMDGIQKSNDVFILAATNRPDLVDSALLRPGRLDKMLYIGSCRDMESKLSVLKALTRKFNFTNDVNLEKLVTVLPSVGEITGADLYGICSNAWLSAARRHIKHLQTSDQNNSDELVLVSNDDMMNAILQFNAKDLNSD